MSLTLALLFALGAADPACSPVEKESITAGDLAAVDPMFFSLPATMPVGYAPAPGRRRIFSVPELTSLAERHGLTVAPTREICLLWPSGPVDPAAVRAAMQSAFPEAAVEVLETSRFDAPNGPVVFTRAGLQRAPSPVMLWRGYVPFGNSRKFEIWARVKVTVKGTRAVATEMLRPGVVIREHQVRIQEFEGPPDYRQFAASMTDVVGHVPTTTIVPGAAIDASALAAAPEVSVGELVNVMVMNGASRVSVDALASSAARRGDMVQLRNPGTGKTFRAKVSGPGQAVIVLGASY
jgi:flagella basal body P-ring formation protein FlgA